MPEGGRINITTYVKDENIYLEISDNGIGMVTGWDIAVDEAKQKGADFIMHKPFQPNQIKQAVANVLKSRAG